ncbi:hypothetical protein JB92DRAFT_2858942 [Gautieria morchelliformis]|nr:hypothetical protein JB92DRAFT_2858942 [Gautieria morchelliformis]
MRDNSTLPQELIDAVTDNLRYAPDRKALLACSLVCRSWRLSSQRLLFRFVSLGRHRDHSKRLGQTLLSYPHLANYCRVLSWHGFWDREYRIETHQAMDQPLFAAVLRKLSKLQNITLYRLDWSLMTVDLHQSIRWVLMLPSIRFLTLDIICDESGPVDFFDDPLALEDERENDDESRPDLERRHLCRLNLGLGFAGNCDAYVDLFLGPRSRFEVSHIRSLGVDHLREDDEQALNRLLRTIGSSLKDLAFRVPVKGDMPLSELGFNIKLEYTPNIRRLCLKNISIGLSLGDSEMYPESFGMNWLLRLLSNIGTSNKLEEIKLDALIGTGYREACSPSGWGQIDRLLAGKFRKLQKLDIGLSATWHGWDNNDEYEEEYEEDEEVEYEEVVRCMVAAHPLLSERGVSVNVPCRFADLGELEEFMSVF